MSFAKTPLLLQYSNRQYCNKSKVSSKVHKWNITYNVRIYEHIDRKLSK